jgi:DNA-binding NarL/FixJ family response regulator
MERDIRDEDIRGELAKAQRDWATITIQFRQARQDIVMKALAAGWSKYAIAQAMGVKGPTVDSIISTARREPKADDR